MRLNIFTIVLLPTLFSLTANAFNFTEYVNENVYNAEKGEKLEVTTAAGLASQNSYLDVSGQSLTVTNRNYALVAVNINDKINAHLSVPFKDPAASRQARVDSDVQCYSLSYDLTPKIKTAALYSRTKGYFYDDKMTNTFYKLPNLSFDQIGLTFFYLTNENHQSAYLDPLLTKRSEDSSSFIYSLGYSHSEASHLDELNLLPNSKSEKINATGITSSHIEALRAQAIYSKNWFWTNWFATASMGLQLGTDFNKKSYAGGESQNENKVSSGIALSFSTGYIWTRFATGFFGRLTQNTYEIDNMKIISQAGNSGAYLSYQF